jgi:putative tricarboxylic transport membrane protein
VLGFLLSFGLLLFVCSYAVERQGLLPSVLVSAASVAVIYGIFVSFLSVPLPAGTLGIL